MRKNSHSFAILLSALFLLAACNSTAPGVTSPATSLPTAEAVVTDAPTSTPVPPSLTLLAELTGTTGPVYNLGWSPDGRTLVSAGYAQVNLWDVEARSLLSTLAGNTDFVWNVAWSPDGSQVASVGVDKTVRLWDITSTQPGRVLEDDAVDGLEFLYSLAWSPDGTRLASGSSRGTVTFWDPQTGQKVQASERSTDITDQVEIISLDWSPDGAVLAAGYLNGEIILWNGANGSRLAVIQGYTTHRCDTNGLAWSPDGQIIATAHQDGYVRLWDAQTYALKLELLNDPYGGWLRGIAWSPDGSLLAVSGQNGVVSIWDPLSGRLLWYTDTGATPLWSVAWSPDGGMLAAGSGRYGKTSPGGTIFLFAAP